MNRLRADNFVEIITKTCHVDMMDSFIMYRTTRGDVYGFWLYEKKDRSRVAHLLKRLLQTMTIEEPIETKNSITSLGRTIDISSLFETAGNRPTPPFPSIPPPSSVSMISSTPLSGTELIPTRVIQSTLKHSLASLPIPTTLNTPIDKYTLRQWLIHLLQVSKENEFES